MVLNGLESDWTEVLAGVHNGSILCPFFFININDVINNIRSSILLFCRRKDRIYIVDDPHTNSDLKDICY